MERLLNCVLQASKAIKNKTALSGGTVSVAFAAVQYIRERVANIRDKNILLLGTGKIGRNTCKNLVDYLKTRKITLINRTEEKAAALAAELGLKHAPLTHLAEELQKADIILVATNATEPTILREHLEGSTNKLIIDLSIPYNVAADAQELPNVCLVNVDELSRIKDETLQKRLAEVPRARAIIAEHIAEFMEWYKTRKYAPVLKTVKNQLFALHQHAVLVGVEEKRNGGKPEETGDRIQKVINGLAVKVRRHDTIGCHCIEAINEFIA
jgi:glutamyl-tRNA reductase